jgi:hypothetical protein
VICLSRRNRRPRFLAAPPARALRRETGIERLASGVWETTARALGEKILHPLVVINLKTAKALGGPPGFSR